MNKDNKSSQAMDIWGCLILYAVAIGFLMGLFEVYWTYLLPMFFPDRRYQLPISTVGRFALIATVIDVFIMLIVAVFLGVLIWIFRRLWQRAHTSDYWPTLIRFLLIAFALSYLYVGIVYSYGSFGSGRLRFLIAITGILLVNLISIMVVWLLGILLRRFGTVSLKAVWILALVILLCMTAMNYLHYRSENTVKLDLPTINIDHAPDILFVTLDTLRADHLACYGNTIVKTPVLDAFAADGCLFEFAFAQSPTTTPSHCSMMTSTYVARNDALNGRAMRTGLPTLAKILQANGYETAAFVSANTVRSFWTGLHRGFDYYEDSISPYTTIYRNDELQLLLLSYLFLKMQNNQIPGHIATNRAISWLNKQRQGPFFLWLHNFDPHTPYDAPSPYKDMYDGKIDSTLPYALRKSRYAGEVTSTDFQLGRILKALKDKGLYDNMLIIVTSDHGEAFGEKHGDIVEFHHGDYLYYTTQHVPLIIKLPGAKAIGRRIQDVVQLIDLAPTVLNYLEARLPESFQGRSLLDLLKGGHRDKPGTAYSEMRTDRWGAHSAKVKHLRAMRTPQVKYICEVGSKQQELYDVVSDPTETINIYGSKPELTKNCYKSIQDTLGEPVETNAITLDPKVIEQLRTLGYLSNGQAGDQEEKK